MLVLEGSDPSKCNAQVARCTVGVNVNGTSGVGPLEMRQELQGRDPKKSGNFIAVLCCFCG